MQDLERAQTRLGHIRTVEPVLGALRTISLGSWQAALRQMAAIRQYGERLGELLPLLLPCLPSPIAVSSREEERQGRAVVVLVVGSERGLCGRFNAAVVERAEAHLDDLASGGAQVELAVLGGRAHRLLQRRDHQAAWSGALSITALPSPDLAFDLASRWLARYEAHELDAVDVVHNAYRGLGEYEPTTTRLIPPSTSLASAGEGVETSVIVETDPLGLYTRVIEQRTTLSLYGLLLDSAAAEHAARYSLMEAATQNADRLIAELTLAIQTARQQAITREMQELAAGAGMVG